MASAESACAGPGDMVHVQVVYSPIPGALDVVDLALPPGATVADALRLSGLAERHPGVDFTRIPTGVWGSVCDPGQTLRDRDRVELYRPLRVDPKEARRERFRQDGKRARGAKLGPALPTKP